MLSKKANETLGSQVSKYNKKRFFSLYTSSMTMKRGHTRVCSVIDRARKIQVPLLPRYGTSGSVALGRHTPFLSLEHRSYKAG